MKTEYIIATAVGCFIFGYVLDAISGPFNPGIRNPFAFLTAVHLSTYPFTAVSIAAKMVGIFIAVVLAVNALAEKKPFFAATLFFVVAALMELYAIQQLATQVLLISLQWTLAVAYAAVFLLIPSGISLLVGVFKKAHHNLTSDLYESDTDTELE